MRQCVLTLMVCAVVVQCGAAHRTTYEIHATRPGWVDVVYSDPNCPAVRSTANGRVVSVAEDGYGCTSSALDKDVGMTRYVHLADGSTRTLELNKDVFRPESFSLKVLDCKLEGFSSWYGDRSAIAGNPRMLCENGGLVALSMSGALLNRRLTAIDRVNRRVLGKEAGRRPSRDGVQLPTHREI